jgi:hypothetical protein
VEITYALDASDLAALRKFRWARNPRAVWTVRGILLLLALGYIGAVIAATFYMEEVPPGLLLILTVIALLVLILWFLIRRAKKKAGEQLEQRCNRVPWRMTLALDGVYVVTDQGQDFTRWCGVLEIAQTPGHAFFVLRTEGQLLAYILPRRAFTSQVDFDVFVDRTRRYRDDYRETAPAPGPVSVDLEYRLTVQDYEAFQAHVGKQKQSSSTAPLWWLGVLGVLVALMSIPALRTGQLPWFLIVFIVVGALFLLTKWLGRRQLRQALRALYAKGPHRLMVASDGLHILVGDSQGFLQWRAIKKIVETPERVFFFTGQAEGQIVPRHAFPSAAEFADFVDLAWRHYERQGAPVLSAARVGPAPPDSLTTKPIQDRLP